MADIHDQTTRRRNMAAIKAKNTKPEIVLRKYLHERGFRFRLHRKDLLGKPDIVMPKFNMVIFVNGCFWHKHRGCKYQTTPATRKNFWSEKLKRNQIRDKKNQIDLISDGWRVLIVWECGLKHCLALITELDNIIKGDESLTEWPRFPPRRTIR